MGGHFQHGYFKLLSKALKAIMAFDVEFRAKFGLHLERAVIEWDYEKKQFEVSIYMSK